MKTLRIRRPHLLLLYLPIRRDPKPVLLWLPFMVVFHAVIVGGLDDEAAMGCKLHDRRNVLSSKHIAHKHVVAVEYLLLYK